MKGLEDIHSEEGGSSPFPTPLGRDCGVAGGELEGVEELSSCATSYPVAKSSTYTRGLRADARGIEIENRADGRQVHFIQQAFHRALHKDRVLRDYTIARVM